MKKTIITTVMAFIVMCTFGQSKKDHYVFPEFKEAVAVFKDGSQQTGYLNYNGLTKNFALLEDGEIKSVSKKDAENVDMVYIENRKFIYRGDQFYEIIFRTSKVELLVEYNATLKTNTEGRNAYGSSSQTTSTQVVSTVENSSVVLNTDLPEAYSVEMKLNYILTDKKGTESFKSLNQIKKHYAKHKKQYKAYVKAKDVDFYDPASVGALISYLKSLS